MQNKRRSHRFVWAMLAGLLISGVSILPLAAQVSTATISGTVTDASGAAIAEAAIQVKNVAIGNYEVQAARMGFSTVVHTGITLTVGAQSVVDFSLPVGQQTQTVTVEGQVSQVET